MPAQALQCKECQAEYPLEARYVCDACFGPLEVAYDFSGLDPAGTRRRIQAGPQDIWRYADFLPFEVPPRTALAAGMTPLIRADRLAERLGIAEQLGFELPDRVVCPVASGSLFTKIARGFSEWQQVGLISGELPTMNGAQAAGCNPVAHAFEQGWDVCKPVKPSTIAKSLAIGNPADGPYAIELARKTGGAVDSVTDAEIVQGIRLLAETTGIFTETAGGVTTAVLRKLAERGDLGSDERVVAVITGEGLKPLDVVRGSFETHVIEPSLAAFEA